MHPHAIVGLFQHPFSFYQVTRAVNYSFSDWKDEMTNSIGIIELFGRSNLYPLRRILLRSSRPNGINLRINQCPLYDIRTPPNAYITTKILQEIAEDFSSFSFSKNITNNSSRRKLTTPLVSVLDTNFLMGPVWDRPKDWNHFTGEAGLMETKFVLSEILKEELSLSSNN